jgi:hypothetical protein
MPIAATFGLSDRITYWVVVSFGFEPVFECLPVNLLMISDPFEKSTYTIELMLC